MLKPLLHISRIRTVLLLIALTGFYLALSSLSGASSATASRQQSYLANQQDYIPDMPPARSPRKPVAQARTRAVADLPSKRHSIEVDTEEIAFTLDSFSINNLDSIAPDQIGIGRDVNVLSAAYGKVFANTDGSNIRLLAIKSPGALALRIHIEDFDLPAGDEVYIYGPQSESHVAGPYKGKGPFKDKQFWADTIKGDTVIIEHYYRGEERSVRISEVSHIFKGLGEGELQTSEFTPQVLPCHTDAMCSGEIEKDAVARITYVNNGSSFVCTGTLLVDRAVSFQPFFLTANHCVGNAASAQTVEFFWRYRSTACNSNTVSTGFVFTPGGSTLLATEQSSDHTLLRVLGTLPGGLVFSGWDPNPKTINTAVFNLNHPDGGSPPSTLSYLRKASGQITSTSSNCSATGLVGGYLVTWSSGTTEPGSSGSGLWSIEGGSARLIGVDSCGEVNDQREPFCGARALFGKFSDFYPDARPFIDPTGGGGGGGGGCLPSPIVINQPVNGSLAQSDCRSRKGIADQYTFSGVAGQQIAISLASSVFDSYLYLIGPTGAVVQEDDDGGGGFNSRIPPAGNFTLPSTGLYTIEATSFDGTGTGSYTLSLTGQVVCTLSLSSTGQQLSSGGGAGSVSVTAQAGCNWTASSNATWISITSGASGSGNGTVNYSVSANSGSSRNGTITIAGQTYTINQSGGCSATTIFFGQSVNGTLSGADCQSRRGITDQYTFTSSAGQQIAISLSSSAFDAYLYLIGPTGAVLFEDDDGGSGTNSRIPQTGGFITLPSSGNYIIEVTSFTGSSTGSYTLNITQQAACSYTLSPASAQFGSAGGTGSISVTAQAGCNWTATSSATWINITSGSNGSGNGTVNYSISGNSGGSRNGTINIQGQVFNISQSEQSGAINELAVDDGSFETVIGLTNGGTDYVVNRITPTSYPATLSEVAIFFGNNANGVTIGAPLDILVGTNPGGGGTINGVSFQMIPSTVQARGQFNVYDIPDQTINSGDFVIGFRMTYPAGVFPTALDNSSGSKRCSYVSTNGTNFTIIDDAAPTLAGNFGIRARLAGGSLPPAGPQITGAIVNGKRLLVSGTGFEPGARLFMDGVRVKKTGNDEVTPTVLIVARKAGKTIARGQTVILVVENPSGPSSAGFSFTRP